MDTNVLVKVENIRIWQNGHGKFDVVQSLSCVRLFMTRMGCSPPRSSVHGFPRQEYWSGLPFPSPEDLPDSGIKPTCPALASRFLTTEPPGKPECRHMLCLVPQSRLTLCNPMDCSPPGSSVHEDSPGTNTEMGCHALLQEIFPTLELNWGLPHCRQILYLLSYQGSPNIGVCVCNYELSHAFSPYQRILAQKDLISIRIYTASDSVTSSKPLPTSEELAHSCNFP